MQPARDPGDARHPSEPGLDAVAESELRRLLAGMQYGSITLIVQDGRVVQIDATHKLRLDTRRSLARRRA